MPTSSRRTRIPVIEQLLANPQDFSFSQAVRLLERAAVLSKSEFKKNNGLEKPSSHLSQFPDQPVARFSPPLKEILRFSNDQSLSFPGSDIGQIKTRDLSLGNEQWEVIVNFIGLTGSMGVMPFHYTEMILQRLKQKDPSLAAFLNVFNHRTTSLFFQASNKYRLPVEYERSQLHKTNKSTTSPHTQSLLSLLGLGTGKLGNRQTVRDESFIFFSGLFAQQVKTPSGLKQIIEHYFDVPAQIDGFIGQWQDLIDDVRTRIGWKGNSKGQNARLGHSAMLGRRGWFAQGKSRIKLGPLNKQQFDKFAPGTGALKSLNEIVRTYLGMEQDYDFVVEVKRDDVPNKIALDKHNPPLLAWNAWLSGKPKTNTDKDDLLEILVSSKRLQ